MNGEKNMKALSVEPYFAMKILAGLKTVECRTWKTDYRGLIAVCSTAYKAHRCIPGHALCVANIIDVVPFTKEHLEAAYMYEDEMPQKKSYAWILSDVRPIKPVPVKGALSLWNYENTIEYFDEMFFDSKKEKENFVNWYKSLYYTNPKALAWEKENLKMQQKN